MNALFAPLFFVIAIFSVLVLIAEVLGRRVQWDAFTAGLAALAKTDQRIDVPAVTEVYLGVRRIPRSRFNRSERRRLEGLVSRALTGFALRTHSKVKSSGGDPIPDHVLQLQAVLEELKRDG